MSVFLFSFLAAPQARFSFLREVLWVSPWFETSNAFYKRKANVAAVHFYFRYRGVMLRDYGSVVCALFTALLLVFLFQLTDF